MIFISPGNVNLSAFSNVTKIVMCGWLALFGITRDEFISASKWSAESVERMHHRGPNPVGTYISSPHPTTHQVHIIHHKRLPLVGAASGVQPIFSEDRKIVLAVNGEVWNHKQLEGMLKMKHHFATLSDCEVLAFTWQEVMLGMFEHLNALFSLCLYDARTDTVVIARGHIGKTPLYWGFTASGILCAASEMKSIHDKCESYNIFPPGHVYVCENFSAKNLAYMEKCRTEGVSRTRENIAGPGSLTRWYNSPWVTRYLAKVEKKEKLESKGEEKKTVISDTDPVVEIPDNIPPPELIEKFRQVLTEEIISHVVLMDPEVKFFVSNSGGVDSSIIVGVVAEYFWKNFGKQIHTCCVGLKTSPDILAAREVAKKWNTIHHEIVVTPERLLANVEKTIYHLETPYVTTVRAGTPMLIMAEEMSKLGFTVNFSGEISDELLGGYGYQHFCPSEEEFEDESTRKMLELHLHDCLRANKIMSAYSIECRVPFGSRRMVDFVMNEIPARYKMCGKMVGGRIEKWILRKAFESYLPESVAFRKKIQFSSGSGGIEHLKKFAAESVSDKEMKEAKEIFSINTPHTKEAYLYRRIFHKFYPGDEAILSVPEVGKTISCSSKEILHWHPSFALNPDDCGSSVNTGIVDSFDALVKEMLAKESKEITKTC